MLLRPQRPFTIVRQLNNPFITDTFYVRAVIRDAYTDTILETLNLTDKTGQRFTGTWTVAPDPSGLGREISIVTSVYTDSGYTTKSENYGDEENTHTIEERFVNGRGGAGGGAGNLDSGTVRRIIREEIEKAKPEEKIPEPISESEKEKPEPMRWDEILKAIESLKTVLKPEKQKPVDLSPIFAGLNQIGQMIENKEVTPETDLTPVIQKIEEGHETGEITREEMKELFSGLEKAVNEQFPKVIAALLSQAVFQIAPTTAKMKLPEEKKVEKEEEGIPFDINALTR